MSDDPSGEQYDVLIERTSLENAILAAALAQSGLKVVHLDRNDYYGDVDACLVPPFEEAPSHVSQYRCTKGTAFSNLGQSRDYNIETCPRLLYAGSDMVQTLRNAGISDYIEFRALNAFHVCREKTFVRVPSSKADIFTDNSMPLIAKRRLMNFLKYCLEPSEERQEIDEYQPLKELMQTKFRLDADTTESIIYSLGQAYQANVSVADTLPTIRMHLKSLGLFGAFPVVIPMYGAGSELCQAFCRRAAVKGCTYILGQTPAGNLMDNSEVTLDLGHTLNVKSVYKRSLTTRRSHSLRHRTIIVKGECLEFMDGGDGACIAFVQSDSSVQCQLYGSSTGVCPKDQSIIYLTASTTSTTEFDEVQAILIERYGLEVIVQLDYVSDTALLSYDDIVYAARHEFSRITGLDSSQFLPREDREDADNADFT